MQPDINHIGPELKFTASRSSGPGGQHVNKVNTRVTLRWDVANSNLLDREQKEIIQQKLAGHINSQGELLLSVQDSRSQLQNKETALNRLNDLLNQAFHRPKTRKTTKPTKASVQKRLDEKKKQAAKKRLRRGLDE